MKNIAHGVIDELFELGKSTTKKSAKQIVKTLNPLDKLTSPELDSSSEGRKKEAEKLRNKSTPLDTERLTEIYKKNDQEKLESLRKHLFDLVKKEEKEVIEEEKNKEEQKKRKEEEEKRRKEEEKKKKQYQQAHMEEPHGKERRSIFSFKRKKKKTMVEYKPSAGKN